MFRSCALGIAVALSLLTVSPASAANGDPIRILVPFAAGGAVDQFARRLAEDLGKALGAPVVIENRGGAGGLLALRAVSSAPPDGTTLLFATSGSLVISPSSQNPMPVDPVKDFEPIAMIGYTQGVLVVRDNLPVQTFPELLETAKRTNMTYASAGPGTQPHIAGEMLNSDAKIKVTHVPFRGVGPSMISLVGGYVDFTITSVNGVLPFIRDKQARALVIFDPEPAPQLPGVKTTAEFGYPDLVMSNWYGLLGPVGMPEDIRKKLETATLEAIRTPKFAELLDKQGVRGAMDSATFKARIADEARKWPPILQKLGIKAE